MGEESSSARTESPEIGDNSLARVREAGHALVRRLSGEVAPEARAFEEAAVGGEPTDVVTAAIRLLCALPSLRSSEDYPAEFYELDDALLSFLDGPRGRGVCPP